MISISTNEFIVRPSVAVEVELILFIAQEINLRELMTDELDAVSRGESITCQPSNSPTTIQMACPVGYLEIEFFPKNDLQIENVPTFDCTARRHWTECAVSLLVIAGYFGIGKAASEATIVC